MSQNEKTPVQSEGAAAQSNLLIEIVKGLKREPLLLFGIGAGIVLLAVLGATNNLLALAVVALVLSAALISWVAWKAMAISSSRSRIDTKVDVSGSELKDSRVGIVEGNAGSRVSTEIKAKHLKAEGVDIAGTSVGSQRPLKGD